MKPIDLRKATWAEIRGSLSGMREKVYWAYVQHGPGTAKSVSFNSGIDVMSLRPRTTELLQLGLMRMVSSEGHDGVYEAVPLPEACEQQLDRRCGHPRQLQMRLTA